MTQSALDRLARSLTGPFAFCGIAVARGDTRHYAISHAPFLRVDANSPFRVASLSKIVVGRAIGAFVKTKAAGWDDDIADILGWPLRHPRHPDVPITLRMLVSHSAGLDDAAGYLIPADQTLQAFFAEELRFQHRPGAEFQYSNLGYVVLGAVIEALSGKAFPLAIATHLPPGAGFNWVGVAPDIVARAIPTYRRDGARYVAQIDDPPLVAAKHRNPGVYSPQGGLRTSLAGMLTLAQGVQPQPPLWSGGDSMGLFESYGAGVQIYQDPSFYPRPLIGHFGNAYGFKGGAWYDVGSDLHFAYALNGLAMGDEDDDFAPAERAIFDAIGKLKEV